MAANYVLLERIELNASTASVTFSNIPQSGYTDLKVVVSNRMDNGGANIMQMRFNGITTGYSYRNLEGNGSSPASSNGSGSGWAGLSEPPSYTANTFSSNEIYIPNYTSGNPKSWSTDSTTENNATQSYIELIAGLWTYTGNPAINSITLIDAGGGNWVANSTFSLYGLAALGTTPAIAPKAAGGNVIAYDGTYWYHAFLSTGTFTPATTLSCDALVVAGGGGGGAYSGGGGGAGGLLGFTSQSFISATSYTVTVGASGAGGGNSSGGTGYGSNGNDSQLGTLTLVKGGGGGGSSKSGATQAGQNGGSGGGGSNSATSGGTATSGQGFNGANYSGGGGGGGGSAEAGNTDGLYAGGDGLSTYSSWGLATTTGQNVSGTVYYAGGGESDSGGGTTGGLGGGGGSSTNATTNTGGGGGAWNGSGSAGNGGSGIVIIRYLAA
jgi:hypothetical protein